MIQATGITVRAKQRCLLENVSLEAQPGELLVILGANGAGKSTLLKTLSGERRPENGEIRMAGKMLDAWSIGEQARMRAFVAQESPLDFPYRVLEVVLMGRTPHVVRREGESDRVIATRALEAVGLEGFEDRRYPSLSGGERQRVHLARALAQVWEPSQERYLLLDEPTSWLDLAHQHQALQLARRFTREGGVAVAVLHDLNLAAQYADRILLLKAGRLLACGAVREVLTPENIRGTYGVEAAVIPHPHLDVPLIVPLAGHDLHESENPHVKPTDPRPLQSA